MNALSPWAIAAGNTFANLELRCLYNKQAGIYSYKVYCSDDSLWILTE